MRQQRLPIITLRRIWVMGKHLTFVPPKADVKSENWYIRPWARLIQKSPERSADSLVRAFRKLGLITARTRLSALLVESLFDASATQQHWRSRGHHKTAARSVISKLAGSRGLETFPHRRMKRTKVRAPILRNLAASAKAKNLGLSPSTRTNCSATLCREKFVW